MSFLDRLLGRENPNIVMQPLYDAVIYEGRRLRWYEEGRVPDTLDGRFDMICAILCTVLLRLEDSEDTKKETIWLTELFVTDMDGQLRQIGIGDMIVGKHIGQMMGALGGRLGAYRDALKAQASLEDALVRNLYRGEAPDQVTLDSTAENLREFHKNLSQIDIADILAGNISKANA